MALILHAVWFHLDLGTLISIKLINATFSQEDIREMSRMYVLPEDPKTLTPAELEAQQAELLKQHAESLRELEAKRRELEVAKSLFNELKLIKSQQAFLHNQNLGNSEEMRTLNLRETDVKNRIIAFNATDSEQS